MMQQVIDFDLMIAEAQEKKREATFIDFDRAISEALFLKLYDGPAPFCRIDALSRVRGLLRRPIIQEDWMAI